MRRRAREGSPRVASSAPQLLFDRRFGPWFWGNLLSNSGDWLFNITAAIVVYQLTGSALLVGMVSAAQFSAVAVISPWAGGLADRLDRRRVLLTGQGLAALSASALAVPALAVGIEGLPGAWPIMVAALGIGVGKAVAQPAIQSVVPFLVEDDDLESAVALTGLTFNVGRVFGPAGAGVLLATLGAEVAIGVNAASFLVFIAAFLSIPIRHRRPPPPLDGSVRSALRHVRGDRTLLILLGCVAAAGFAADPVITLGPSLANVLGGTDVLVAAMASAFGLMGAPAALSSGRLQLRFGSLRLSRFGMLATATGMGLAAVAPTAWVALLGFAAAGGGFMLAVTSSGSLIHRRIPDELRGRIMALWGVAFLGTRPVAALVNGAVADLTGPRLTMILAVLVALAGMWMLRSAALVAPPAGTGEMGTDVAGEDMS